MQQVMLGFVNEEPEVVALEPEVEELVVTLMARLIVDGVRKDEGSKHEEQTDQQ